jgi:5-methylcytosine-specific restriction endonuclease McrA
MAYLMTNRLYDPVKRHEYYLKTKERTRQQSKAWYEANKERHKELRTRWYHQNKDHLHSLQREWYIKNREKHLENSRRWSAEHLELKANYRRARRSLIAGAKGSATIQQIEARVAYYGWRCAYCGGPFEEVDHVIPLSQGGTNWLSNLRPACSSCNRRKFCKPVDEFMNCATL